MSPQRARLSPPSPPPCPPPSRGGSHGFGGATYGLNAPPGTAEATGLSNPSLLTDETPNTQSSTRMWGSFAPQIVPSGAVLVVAQDWFCWLRASVLLTVT